MSFFTKAFNDTGRFFRKNVKPLGDNFFRKNTGGLDRLSRGLRQSSSVVGGLGKGVRELSQSPLVLAGGTVLGSYMGNPLLGAQLQAGGATLGSGLEEGSTLLGAGREITNRNKYMTNAQKQAEREGVANRQQRKAERRERNELEKLLPSVPTTPPMSVSPTIPVYTAPALDYQNPAVNFSFG
jgi:hypothetical protein